NLCAFRDILKEGGSAVDAAIAALLCTSLVNPQSMGLGGGAIFTIMDKSGKVKVISSRETVPKNFRQDLLQQCPKNLQPSPGPEWIGVPGELRGYARAHQLYGKLPWARLFEPTIKLAQDGFPMPQYLAKILQHEYFKPVLQKTSLCELFCHENKTVLNVGDTLRYPKLAETMKTIATEGAEAFYTGKIAKDLIQDVQNAGAVTTWLIDHEAAICNLFTFLFVHLLKTHIFTNGEISNNNNLANKIGENAKEVKIFLMVKGSKSMRKQNEIGTGGHLSLEDLRSFEVRVDEAQTVSLGEYEMYIPPLPAGGALIGFILNIMRGFGLSPASSQGDQRARTLHRYIEAVKFANGQKRNIKDPKYNHQNVDYMIESDFADSVRAKITDSGTHPASFYNITPSSDRFGTTHVSVLADDGSAVSVTSTINHIFGSMVYSPKTGIILNNELDDFCGRSDSISAGEQPPSSMAPTILRSKNREKILVIGGSGGSMITSAVAQSIMNHLWLGKSLQDAITEKVVFVDSRNSVHFETGYEKELIDAMKSLGHSIQDRGFYLNVVNAVEKEHGCINAVSDDRKNGIAEGY
ncbi:hypothetical protein NFI96_023118, partial [Prochilodus magdalenae]